MEIVIFYVLVNLQLLDVLVDLLLINPYFPDQILPERAGKIEVIIHDNPHHLEQLYMIKK